VKGCDRPAGTLWSPYWCFEHNVERIRRISRQLDEIASAYERRCAEARTAQKPQRTRHDWCLGWIFAGLRGPHLEPEPERRRHPQRWWYFPSAIYNFNNLTALGHRRILLRFAVIVSLQ
jgi:hypothetical protein